MQVPCPAIQLCIVYRRRLAASGGHGVAPATLAGELLAHAMTGEAPLPAVLSVYGPEPTFGRPGRIAAQLT